MTARPRFATARDDRFATEGGEVARLARLLGKPFMPHQRQVADVALERRTDGGYRYRLVMVTIPRQSGKTTMLGPVLLHRIITRPGISAFYTAQTGKDATNRFNDFRKLVDESSLGRRGLLTHRRSIGSEAIIAPNGSALRKFAPTPGSIHGETPPLVALDEIWYHDQLRGHDLLGAITPAQITLGAEAQIWLVSTMGTANSGFMNDLVERGRAGEPGMAYFEWALHDGADPYDRKAWWDFHPALGLTLTEDAMATDAASLPPGEWLRAMCNRRSESTDPLLTDTQIDELAREPEAVPDTSQITLAYDAGNGDAAAVMACWRDTDGMPVTRTVYSAPGWSWLAGLVRELADTWKPRQIAADDGGLTRLVTDELTRGRLEVATTGTRDYSTACDGLLTAAREERTLKTDGSEALARAFRFAVLKRSGETTRISRASSLGPVAALIATAVGLWAHDHAEAPDPAPVFYSRTRKGQP